VALSVETIIRAVDNRSERQQGAMADAIELKAGEYRHVVLAAVRPVVHNHTKLARENGTDVLFDGLRHVLHIAPKYLLADSR
jgi:hypothetical protein